MVNTQRKTGYEIEALAEKRKSEIDPYEIIRREAEQIRQNQITPIFHDSNNNGNIKDTLSCKSDEDEFYDDPLNIELIESIRRVLEVKIRIGLRQLFDNNQLFGNAFDQRILMEQQLPLPTKLSIENMIGANRNSLIEMCLPITLNGKKVKMYSKFEEAIAPKLSEFTVPFSLILHGDIRIYQQFINQVILDFMKEIAKKQNPPIQFISLEKALSGFEETMKKLYNDMLQRECEFEVQDSNDISIP